MTVARPTSVQAGEPTYELHSLGWKAFQHLCVSIAGQVWGQVVQGYFDSHDGGRDGAFHGTWSPRSGESFQGSFVAQCKFSSQANKVLHLNDLKDELAKATRLAERGLADNYILFTSGRLTGASDEKMRRAFEAIPGVKRFAAYGADRNSQFIQESPRLRMLVPRVYGLGDLSQILDERAYAQAREILSALGDDLAKFVITDAHQRAAKSLTEHGFVLLLGEPACGKSTIAASLALGALDQWGCFALKIRDADEFARHSNPHEVRQFFWVDDAFGATQLDWFGTQRWNGAFGHIQAAIRRGARVVFTSRDYIYRSARNLLKESALPIIQESRVVIRVEQLTNEEREQILYNHIRLGTQPKDFKRALKSYLPSVAVHPRFSPEIARRLGNPAFTQRLQVWETGLEQFVAHPTAWLREVIRTIDASSRSAIALVFMRGGKLPSPVALTQQEQHAIVLLGGSEAEVRNSLVALDGSLLIRVQEGGVFSWRFKHPTIRDAFAELIAANRELLDIYITGTPLPRLFQEISCGDVGLEGVKVIVPQDRYGVVLSRIQAFATESRENRNHVNGFLSRRCDQGFLSVFTSSNPNFIEALYVGSYLYAVSDVDVIIRLHEFGLLPEAERLRHVAAIRDLAVETPDAGFLRQDVRRLLNRKEFCEILDHVRANLLSDLDACVEVWRENYTAGDDPNEYFSELKAALTEYREAFCEDPSAVALIDGGLATVDEAIEALRDQARVERGREGYHGAGAHRGQSGGSRSIFDDVDQ
jgi:hypothetical protein